MRFFVDFEATQPGNEIISVGLVCEDGDTYHSYVKPSFSELTPFITSMTGITSENLDTAPDLNAVFFELYNWLMWKERVYREWKFYVYGNSDAEFLKQSACNLRYNESILLCGIMLLNLIDYSQTTKAFFRGGVSLINAFNYVEEQSQEQHHNALEDALMLQKVVGYVETNEPLSENPFFEGRQSADNAYTMPTGMFVAKDPHTHHEIYFTSCDDAVDWVITNLVRPQPGEIVHRNRIAINIMKSIKKKSKYQNYKWRRFHGA